MTCRRGSIIPEIEIEISDTVEAGNALAAASLDLVKGDENIQIMNTTTSPSSMQMGEKTGSHFIA